MKLLQRRQISSPMRHCEARALALRAGGPKQSPCDEKQRREYLRVELFERSSVAGPFSIHIAPIVRLIIRTLFVRGLLCSFAHSQPVARNDGSYAEEIANANS
jgi:hypothetical protein